MPTTPNVTMSSRYGSLISVSPSTTSLSPTSVADILPIRFNRCPLCDQPFSYIHFPSEASRERHINICLEDFHSIAKATTLRKAVSCGYKGRDLEEQRRKRFAAAEWPLTFSLPSSQVAITPPASAKRKRRYFFNEKAGKKRPCLVEIDEKKSVTLPDDIWKQIIAFCPELTTLRTCSPTLYAMCEREALERLAARLWMRVLFSDSDSVIFRRHFRRRSHVATEAHSRRVNQQLEVIPCVNVSLQGHFQAHLVIVPAECSYKEFVEAWERATGIQSDRAKFAVCFENNIRLMLDQSNYLRMTVETRYLGFTGSWTVGTMVGIGVSAGDVGNACGSISSSLHVDFLEDENDEELYRRIIWRVDCLNRPNCELSNVIFSVPFLACLITDWNGRIAAIVSSCGRLGITIGVL